MQKLLNNLNALLVTNPTNIRYLIGLVGVAENEREAYVLVTPTQTFLFTNALYREEAASLKRLNLLGTIEISRENPFSKKLAETLKRLNPALQGLTLKTVRVGFEENDLTVAEYHKIMHEHKNVRLIPTQNRVEELRMIKRNDEIENIRAAAKLTDQCFDFILEKLKPGVTEKTVAWEIESFIRSRGAQLAFSPIVAFGEHTSQPHYNLARHSLARLQESVLRKQDVVLLDFGARVSGYCSDMTRVVFVGKPKDEWAKAYETVLAAQSAALDYLASRPSIEAKGAKADRVAREIITKSGFPAYPHSLGHGVGLDIHEAPRLTIKKPFDKLRAGMVVTIEPAIYVEASYGIRIEDLILLKNEGIELLSKSEKGMIVV